MELFGTMGRSSWLAAFAVAAVASPGRAQRDTTVVSPTRFEIRLETLAKALDERRDIEIRLTREMQALQELLQAVNAEDARARAERAYNELRAKLHRNETLRLTLVRQLDSVCVRDQKPQGWIGVVFNGPVRVEKNGDGPEIYDFLQYPVLESPEPGGPAFRAGLRAGDVVLRLADADLSERRVVMSELLKPGAHLSIRVRRDGIPKSFNVVVEPRPEEYGSACPWLDERLALARVFTRTRPRVSTERPVQVVQGGSGEARDRAERPVVVGTAPMSQSFAYIYPQPGSRIVGGAQLIAMSDHLKDALGVSGGVLVLRVVPGVIAYESGLRDGDVIVAVNDRETNAPLAVVNAVSAAEGEAKLTIIRRQKRHTLVMRWE